MPTTVFASSGDMHVRDTSTTSWSDAQGTVSTTGTNYNGNASNFDFGIYNIYTAGRGAATFTNIRSYFPFQLSSLSGTVVSAKMTLNTDFTGLGSTNEATVRIIQATALANGNADYGNCYSSGTTFGTTLGEGVVSTTLGNHDFNFNSDGVTAINNAIGSGTLTVAALGYYDYTDTAPSLGGDYVQIAVAYSERGGTSSDPALVLTFEQPIEVNPIKINGGLIVKGGNLKIL